MTDFDVFVRSVGLIPRGPVVPDGRWHRCGTQEQPKKRNGAYKLAIDGRVGFVQDWSIHEAPLVWRPDRAAKLPDFDVAAFRREQRKAREAARSATLAARAYYAECAPLRGGHPYLEAHDLDMTGCVGLKVDDEGWLVVPCLRGRHVMSVQRIAPDGTKLFWRGASVSGTTYTIARRHATLTVLSEGLATGLACYAAAPMARVIVAWNAGNLASLDITLTGFSVVAADNDHATEERTGSNPGVKAALAAAESLGCGVTWPEGIEGTDWADYRQELVAERVAMARRYDSVAAIRRDVDARIRSSLMREAKYVRRSA